MHTFMVKRFVDKIGMQIDDLGYEIVVSTPFRAVFTTGVHARDVAIVIEQCILLTNLTALAVRKVVLGHFLDCFVLVFL